MNRRDQNAQRARWRENSKIYLEKKRKKTETVQVFIDESEESVLNTHSTDEFSDLFLPSNVSSPTSNCQCNMKIRKLRYKMTKEKKILEQTICFLKKQNLKYRNSINSLEDKDNDNSSSFMEVKKKQQVATYKEKLKLVKKFFESDIISYVAPVKINIFRSLL